MPQNIRHRPRVFVDTDVLFAGAASSSKHGASLVILRMGEITLIEALTSEQVITEAERNLEDKLPQAVPMFRLLVNRCLRVVPDPRPADLLTYTGAADPKDLPILVAAVRESCPWLITFNVRHFRPGLPQITVFQPADFILHVRDRLAGLAVIGEK